MKPTFEINIVQPGHFFIDCNYWASHAGTQMWSNWQPEVVQRDMERLSAAGLQVLRVFPLWPDFQPLSLLKEHDSQNYEFRFGEEPLPDDQPGQCGVSLLMIERFKDLSVLAEQYHLKLIIGLITGWMSGRLYVPPALKGRLLLTDPLSLMWQTRFVKYFVNYFKGNSSILAWDLGNECNAMQKVPDRASAWHWTASIVNAIRSVDPDRSIISGMHSLAPEGKWTMQDQGELTDILTTHPYPIFTPYCNQEPVNTIRPLLHATAESRFYADIGNRPCLVEEIGTLGPMIASEEIAADFGRVNLFSNWAHDNRGMLWWCAYDQNHLSHAPYDWQAVERELGLLRVDGRSKPVLQEMGKFREFLDKWPYQGLAPNLKEAVCILSQDQNQWGVGYASFILAKQAGFDLEFQYASQPLKSASLYLLPSIKGLAVIDRRRWLELLERVKAGATLYISYDGGFLSSFEEVSGLTVQTRSIRHYESRLHLEMEAETIELEFKKGSFKLQLEANRANVIGKEISGEPAFTQARYGEGEIYFLDFPLEMELTEQPGVFEQIANPYWKLYQYFSRSVLSNRIVKKVVPDLGVTEHILDSKHRLAVLTNYSPINLETSIGLEAGWELKAVYYGNAPTQLNQQTLGLEVPKADAIVLLFRAWFGEVSERNANEHHT